MAEKDQVKPSAPIDRATVDEESATLQSEEVRRKKRIKIIGYVVVFILFHIIVFVTLGLTVLRVKAPNVGLNSITIESISIDTVAPAAFNMRLSTEVAVKNKNWGEYKFRNSTMILSYQGVTVGEAQIPARKAKARGTRRMNVTMDVTSDRLSDNPNLSNDLNSGSLTLNSYTKLNGKVTLMYMMKRNKNGEMNCTITINTRNRTLQELNCK